MPSPYLLIRRVVVEGELSCDIPFFRGMNVIEAVETNGDNRSTNNCGKTTLIELIQHGLGRRQKSNFDNYFVPLGDQVDKLFLEIEINDQVFTIERSIRSVNAAMLLREGPYVKGAKSNNAEKISIEEISQVLLNLLNIPQVEVKKSEGGTAPLSFPTLMRAFILHQAVWWTLLSGSNAT